MRPREVARYLKTSAHLQITPALEASIEHSINDCKRFLQPAALYTTLTRATAQKTTPLTLADKAVAVSVVAVTIGSALEEERKAALARQDTMQTVLLGAIQQEGVYQATHFAIRLLQEQGKEEECDMSPPMDVPETALLSSLAALLGIGRIGLALESTAPSLPPYARLTWMSWMPKRDSALRSEKAAV